MLPVKKQFVVGLPFKQVVGGAAQKVAKLFYMFKVNRTAAAVKIFFYNFGAIRGFLMPRSSIS
jgi:hypothetical protein